MSLPKLSALIPALCELRTELRSQGASQQEIDLQTERLVRHFWEPYAVDERFWPDWARRAVCQYCDGTGLVVHRHVTNRLGLPVDEGVPCRCGLGARFLKREPIEPDHTGAGKTPTKPRPFTRLGR